MPDDAQLLQRYAASRCGDAFAELVRRHMPLVYAAALRQVHGAVHRAEDVTQTVFIELARNAGLLAQRREIAGWLYTTTHHMAAKLKRSEQRRQTREQEARSMQENSTSSAAAIEWERLRPVLDEAMLELGESEREVILMRFFQARPFADVGRSLGLTEDAARMRLERALEKLRRALARRDITSTTAALGLALVNQPVVAASTTLAASVLEAVMSGAGTAAGAGGVWATLMSMTKLQVGISGALVVAVTTGFVLQARSNTELRTEADRLRQENAAIAELRSVNRQLAQSAVEVAEMRRDDVELARLNHEAAALKLQLEQVTRLEQARAARPLDRLKLDQVPRPRHQIRPDYPAALRSMGVDGEVLVDFVVDALGDVREARALRSSLRGENRGESEVPGERVRLVAFTVAATPPGDGRSATDVASVPGNELAEAQILVEMEAAALDAVSQWKFDAGRKGGRDVSTRMTVPVVFMLARPEDPSGAPARTAAAPGP